MKAAASYLLTRWSLYELDVAARRNVAGADAGGNFRDWKVDEKMSENMADIVLRDTDRAEGATDLQIEPLEPRTCARWSMPNECQNPAEFSVSYFRKRARTATIRNLCRSCAVQWCIKHGITFPPTEAPCPK